MKIVTVLGAKPRFIKSALVSHKLRKENHEVIIHTSHHDIKMSDIFLKEMSILEPDYNLGVGSASHTYQTDEMRVKLKNLFVSENPDLILLKG